ncbi:DUF1700 domain-containing protein [Enterococcus timonensis]|uniref:DUF1700 domain-containing protein n=1 Tax=Enterococcus timonensis TaxID=1852364 RepID=UPI0008DB1EFE|nr:DUF1700 domain-containing protein [Enterococcus timonensis]
MNEEHFLTELAIYLKPLAPEKKDEILASYAQLFQEGKATGQAEELIAKNLGKPKDIATEILSSFNLSFEEKKIYRNGWQEFSPRDYQGPRFDKHDYTSGHAEENPYQEDVQEDDQESQNYCRQNTSRQSSNFLVKLCLVLFNLFVMIWVVISVFLLLVGAWLIVTCLLSAPLIGIFLFFTVSSMSVALFQLGICIGLFGLGLLGLLVGQAVTKFLTQANRNYWAFNRRVMRGAK